MDIKNSLEDGESGTINRRQVLQATGAGLVGATMLTGTASATKYQFYGCSQVCTDSRGGHAVVATGDGYECRPLFGDFNSDRQNQRWQSSSRCYEAKEGESVVGILKSPSKNCVFCVNPNNCASNYYDDVSEIVDDLNSDQSSCGECGREDKVTTGDCDVTGTGRPSNESPGNGGQSDDDADTGSRGNNGGNGPPHGNSGPPHGNSGK